MIVLLFLLFGLYLPTSISGEFSKPLMGVDYALCACLATWTIWKGNHASRILFPIAMCIPSLILLFTVTSGFTTLTLWALLPYYVLSIVLLLRVKSLAISPRTEKLFMWANVFNIALGFGMMFGVEAVQNFIGSHYAYIDSDFVAERMLSAHKPVITFYTHSIAGFMLYLFFYMNLRAFQVKQKKIYFWLSFGYLLLVLGMFSVTGIALFLLGSLQMFYVLWKTQRRFALTMVATCYLLFVGLNFVPLQEIAASMLENKESGLSGRYALDGTMYPAIQYLKAHPFNPVGASIRGDIAFGDSGPLEYLLRGSLPLLILIYGLYFLFLKSNLKNRSDFWLLFLVTLGFEFGDTTLTYLRFLWLIPFVCVYLNHLQNGFKPDMQIVGHGVSRI